jgi:hypothetical protein
MGIKVTGDSVDDNLTPDWSFEKRLSAGLFNQLNAITLDSQENIHKLTVTSLLSGQTESDLVKTGRKIPLTKWVINDNYNSRSATTIIPVPFSF